MQQLLAITLTSTVEKIYTRILQNLRQKIEPTLEESQGGFRKGRDIHDQIVTMRQVCEKAVKTRRNVHTCHRLQQSI